METVKYSYRPQRTEWHIMKQNTRAFIEKNILPNHPNISQDEIDLVVETHNEFFNGIEVYSDGSLSCY